MSNKFNLHRVDQEINQLNFLNRMFTLQMICCSVAFYYVHTALHADFLYETGVVKFHTNTCTQKCY